MLADLIDKNAYLGSGISRRAYRSFISGYIVKENYSNFGAQHEGEKTLFEMMSPEDRMVFPVVAIEDKFIMMRECLPLEDFEYDSDDEEYLDSDDCENEHCLLNFCEKYNLDTNSVESLFNFISKYGVKDIHTGNIGILENRLVLIDAGSNSSNDNSIWSDCNTESCTKYSSDNVEEYNNSN